MDRGMPEREAKVWMGEAWGMAHDVSESKKEADWLSVETDWMTREQILMTSDQTLMTRDETLMTRDENLMTCDETLMTRDETLMTREQNLITHGCFCLMNRVTALERRLPKAKPAPPEMFRQGWPYFCHNETGAFSPLSIYTVKIMWQEVIVILIGLATLGIAGRKFYLFFRGKSRSACGCCSGCDAADALKASGHTCCPTKPADSSTNDRRRPGSNGSTSRACCNP